MKKLLILLMATVSVLCFAGCNNDTSDDNTSRRRSAEKSTSFSQECVREYDDDGNLDCEIYYENGNEVYVVNYKNGKVLVSFEYCYNHEDQLVEAIRYDRDGIEDVRLQYYYTPDGELDTVIKIRDEEEEVWDHISEGQNSDYPHRITAIW